VQCEQYRLNQVLAERLATKARIEFGCQVTDVRQDAASVTVLVNGTREIKADWVIGADGGRSRVREALGIALEGFTWPERFLVASTPFDFAAATPGLCDVAYFADPEEWFFLLRVPGVWRAMFPVPEEEKDEAALSDESVQRRLRRVHPSPSQYEVRHRTLYSVHQRVAQSYRKGRCFLAGDAAHLNNPLGGMGMNGGIHDAFNLAEKLAAVIAGRAAEDELDPLRAPAPAGGARVRQHDYNRQQAEPGGEGPRRAPALESADDAHRGRPAARARVHAADLDDREPAKVRMRLALVLFLYPLLVFAQPFPTRAITIVVPFPPGSTSDLIPRALAPALSQSMGVPVVVDNRPGASGNLGAALVAHGDASGHQVLTAPSAILATNRWLYKQLTYDPQKDLTPVINAAATPNMWVAHPDTPVKTIGDVLALAKAKPGALAFASGGNGTTGHLCGELLKTDRQGGHAARALQGSRARAAGRARGRVPLMCDNFSNVITHVRSGRLKAVALTALKRHPQAPEVPTADESGCLASRSACGTVSPCRQRPPKPVVQKLNAGSRQGAARSEIAERFERARPHRGGRFAGRIRALRRRRVRAHAQAGRGLGSTRGLIQPKTKSDLRRAADPSGERRLAGGARDRPGGRGVAPLLLGARDRAHHGRRPLERALLVPQGRAAV
jgi:tripartite-type tricarboxylate transporter receptor subunit TctC